MNHLAVIIPSNEPLVVVKEYLPNICASSSNSFPISILLVDSKSQSEVKVFCESLNVQYVSAGEACRAVQLNLGASFSNGDFLFFLHLDSTLPINYDLHIQDAFKRGADSGCFQMRFSPATPFLNFWAYFTKFHLRVARGGDQGLFLKRSVFNQIGGYKDWPVMEDVQICHQLEKGGVFKILETHIITSSRKYRKYGQVYLQTIFVVLMILFWIGVKPTRLMQIYNRFLGKD